MIGKDLKFVFSSATEHIFTDLGLGSRLPTNIYKLFKFAPDNTRSHSHTYTQTPPSPEGHAWDKACV